MGFSLLRERRSKYDIYLNKSDANCGEVMSSYMRQGPCFQLSRECLLHWGGVPMKA